MNKDKPQGPAKELTAHCKTKEDKEAWLQQIQGAMPVLNKYQEIIERKISKKQITKEIDYDCPSWSYKQADANGYARAIKEILKLLPPTTMEK